MMASIIPLVCLLPPFFSFIFTRITKMLSLKTILFYILVINNLFRTQSFFSAGRERKLQNVRYFVSCRSCTGILPSLYRSRSSLLPTRGRPGSLLCLLRGRRLPLSRRRTYCNLQTPLTFHRLRKTAYIGKL